jgi:hypothetical protein
VKSAALQQFFQVERGFCNQMVASVRHQSPAIDTDDLDWFISNCLDPLMISLDKDSHQVSFPIAQAGFSHGLELAAHNWLKTDQQQEILRILWSGFHVEIKQLLQQDAVDVFADIGNLLNHLFSSDTDFPIKWLKLMIPVSGALTSLTLLRQTGLVCAWMSGLAHYRKAALQQLESLPKEIVRKLFDLPDNRNISQHVAALKSNRWRSADDNQAAFYHLQTRVGSCSLLDGDFPAPPQVYAFDNQLFVKSGALAWQLHVDLFGSSLLPCDADDIESYISTNNCEQNLDKLDEVPGLDDINTLSSTARLPDTIAMTATQTFAIIILSIADAPQANPGHSLG